MSLLNNDSLHTRIKICGLSTAIDIHTAMNLGVDAIGLVFYPPSPRCLDMTQGATLSRLHDGTLQNVVLVVDADDHLIKSIKDHCKIDIWQFHGNETPQRCSEIAGDLPWLKAARVDEKFQLDDFCLQYRDASAWILDAVVEGFAGAVVLFETGFGVDETSTRPAPREDVDGTGGMTTDEAAVDFLAADFFTTFLAAVFFTADFLTVFFATDFFAVDFLATDFLTALFFTAAFLAAGFFFTATITPCFG
jgi:phosphoribosylanthranilate isomerase